MTRTKPTASASDEGEPAELHVLSGLQRGDDAEQQHREDVVDHGGAEDHAALLALQHAEFLQYACGDAGGRRDEGGGDEQRLGPVEPGAVRPQRTEQERHDDAENADEKGAATDAFHFVDARLQADREQQQHDADFGEHFERHGGSDPAEHRRPDDAARGDFADDTRQLQRAGEQRSDLCGDEDDDER